MNESPGMADPGNTLLPFGRFPWLHFARLVILQDPTLADIEVYGETVPRLPLYVAFIGDCDGDARECLAEIVGHCSAGLRRIFGHCEDFDPDCDLLEWLHARDLPIAASYVNWVGR